MDNRYPQLTGGILMKKFLLATGCALCFTCCTPVATRANTIESSTAVTAAQFTGALNSVTDTVTKYTTTTVNIRKEPNADSEILGQSMRGGSFEIVTEINGWAMITTEDGYAYMKADWFSDVPVSAYSDEDLKILAMILCGEAQSLPDEEQRLVGSVFLNRIKSNKFPNTFLGVAQQKGQYACWWDGNAYRQITDRNWKNARWLLENGSILPDYVVGQSGEKHGTVYLKTKYHYYYYWSK